MPCSIVEMRMAPVAAVHDPHRVVWRSDHTTEAGMTSEPSHTRARYCARAYGSALERKRFEPGCRDLIFDISPLPDLTISASGICKGTDNSIIPSRNFAAMVCFRRAEAIRRTVSPSISTTEAIRPPERCSISSRLKVEIVSMSFMLYYDTS